MTENSLEKSGVWTSNAKLLDGFVVFGTIFQREALNEFRNMVEESKSEKISVNKVLSFINPGNRRVSADSITAFGLGYILDQEIKMASGSISGVDRQKALDLQREVYANYENILKAIGLPDPHIVKRNEEGVLEHPVFQKAIGSETANLTENYIDSFNNLFDYFESLFDPKDVIAYSEQRLDSVKKYLAGGINVRTSKKLTSEEISRETKRIKGYEEAIERNKLRMGK